MTLSYYGHDDQSSIGIMTSATTRRRSKSLKIHSILSSMETVLHFIFGACSYACHTNNSTTTTNTFETYNNKEGEEDDDDHTSKTSDDQESHSPYRADFYSGPISTSHVSSRSSRRHSLKGLGPREHTTIAVSKLHEDDVSCISSHTLEKMASSSCTNRRHPNRNSSSSQPFKSFQHPYRHDSTNDKENIISGKKNSNQVFHDAQSTSGSFSVTSSNGTSEFTSVWKQPPMVIFSPTSSSSTTTTTATTSSVMGRKDSFYSNSSQNATIMNDNIQQHDRMSMAPKSNGWKTSHRDIILSNGNFSRSTKTHSTKPFYESPGSRKLRRQIMKDGIGTIDEIYKEDYSSREERESIIVSDEHEV